MKTSIISATLALTIGLSACGERIVYVESTVPPTEPPVETTIAPTTTVAPTTTTEPETRPTIVEPAANPQQFYDPEGYLDWLYVEAPDLYWGLNDEDLINIGLIVCQMWDEGYTLMESSETLIDAMINTGTTQYAGESGVAMAAAAYFLCPEYTDWLIEELGKLGY